jgi:hypothetical protein
MEPYFFLSLSISRPLAGVGLPLLLIGDCAVPPRRESESKSKKNTGGAAVVGSTHFGNKGGALQHLWQSPI